MFSLCARAPRAAANCFLAGKFTIVFSEVPLAVFTPRKQLTRPSDRHFLQNVTPTTTFSLFARASRAAANCFLAGKFTIVFSEVPLAVFTSRKQLTRPSDRHFLQNVIPTTTFSLCARASRAAANCFLAGNFTIVFS